MFDWLVQAYDSNMTLSNDFFFVMRPGGPANTITPPLQDDDAVSPSFKLNKLRNTNTIQTSSSTTDSATPATAQLTTAPSPEGPSPSASGDQSSNTPTTPSLNPDAEHQENEGGGALSVAAQAGIGVGVSVFAIIASACGVILFRYLKKQHKVVAELWERHHGADPKTRDMEHPQQKEGDMLLPIAEMGPGKTPTGTDPAPEYPGGGGGAFQGLHWDFRKELEAPAPVELDAMDSTPRELDGTDTPRELGATDTPRELA